MRLNVYLQKAGVGSRREAERMIADARITVNGKPAEVTTPVEDGDTVCVDGKPVSAETRALPRLFILHKPVDVLCTTFDKEGRKTIFDLPALKSAAKREDVPRLMNVGRLDVNSEGLLLMSSDGQLAQAMMSPQTGLERVYRVRVRGSLGNPALAKMKKGMVVDGVRYRGAKVEREQGTGGANNWYRITITEGKNREVRKLMEHFGCVVNRLIRVSYGPFMLGDIPKGQMVEIPPKRVEELLADLAARGAKL